jgi:hypothetical protein
MFGVGRREDGVQRRVDDERGCRDAGQLAAAGQAGPIGVRMRGDRFVVAGVRANAFLERAELVGVEMSSGAGMRRGRG